MGDQDGRKFAEAHIPYKPEETLVRVEIAIGTDGSGGVACSFYQEREPREHDAREHNVALLRQAADMLLEHATNM